MHNAQEKQAALTSLEANLAAQHRELATVTSELGKARSDLLTQVRVVGERERRRGGRGGAVKRAPDCAAKQSVGARRAPTCAVKTQVRGGKGGEGEGRGAL